ncbi:MAG: hypothetical protein E7372_05185 [Clostridiales bacterium]|nr:hypothetical protein [Clostridiales bacterium]
MTRKTNSKFPTIKKLLVFILATLMCLSLFMATACKEDDQADKIPEYSYSDKVDGEIKNPSFTFGTQSMKYSDYPKTTVDGWSFTKVATSKSGVVDVSNYGWTALMSNLYKDDGLLSYVKYINDFDNDDIREIIKDGNDDKTVTTDEIKQYIIENYFLVPETKDPNVKYAFENPGTHANDIDNKVYMLNNYTKGSFAHGCVQTVTSATEITLKQGEYAKVSAWVKTANLNTDYTENLYGKPIGASISIKNTFNGSTQSNYGIYNITNNVWKQFTFYIKADAVFETKFTLQLSLGHDNYSATGTVYFDDINVELLDADEYNTSIANYTNTTLNTVSYNNKDAKPMVNASNYDDNTLYLYDMNVNIADISGYSSFVSFHTNTDDQEYYGFTQYKGGNFTGNYNNAASVTLTPKTNLDAPYGISEGLEVKLNNPASYSIKLDNNGQAFKLNGESYSAITFFVKNNLNKLYSPNIIINVQDKFGTEIVERPAVATISEASGEWAKYTITIMNNFDEDKHTTPREFYLEIVIGPDEYTSAIDNYALGTVTITEPIISSGKTYQYATEQDEENEIETSNYQYYKLLSSTSAGTTALYAGYSEDYTPNEADTESYSLVVASSSIGQILNNPTTPRFYTGIESGHYYITGNEQDTIKINNNAYAGLVNSKYLNNYKQITNLADIEDALNYTDDGSIQPLMIKTEGKSYGYISENYSIGANSYAKVSVKVRVYGADAYIYIVDTSKTEKTVMKLDSFTVNTAEGEYDNNGQVVDNKELLLVIDETMLDDAGWVTVEFYIATGATEKDFRVELWNGARDNTTALTENGYVFFDDIIVKEANAFEEHNRWQDALTEDISPLYNQGSNIENPTDLILYQRELTALEKKYNAEENGNISYAPNYVWAKTYKMIYAIYNTIDPTEVDPYASDVEEDTTQDESLYETDPATFWLSLSSIVIGVALIVAIIMLFIKNFRNRRRANRNDAKSHFTVRSRTKKPAKSKVEEIDIDIDDIDINIDEPTNEEANNDEQSLDSYVYGDVQVFGDEDKADENKNEND